MATKKNFDFGKMQKSFITTKTKDGRTLVVNMPRKSTFEKMAAIQNMDEDDVSNDEAYDGIVELMAEILSNNKNGDIVTTDEVAKDYDLEEMLEYIKKYGEFVQTLKTDPN